MASKTPGWQITPRDLDLLGGLAYAPFTTRQLRKLSQTWPTPFGSDRLVRERLQRLAAARLVESYPYAIVTRGQPENYHVLTRQGYEFVHGPGCEPPAKGSVSRVALARQPHQRALSNFIVHTLWGCWKSVVRLASFHRENAIRLDAAGHSLYPDCTFVLCVGDELFRFYVEIDNGTERIQSLREVESIDRKICTYEAMQDIDPTSRFRVLFVSAQDSVHRLQNILRAAGRVTRDPNRTLFYGITMGHYLTSDRPIVSPIFLDRRGRSLALIPDAFQSTFLQPAVLLTADAA